MYLLNALNCNSPWCGCSLPQIDLGGAFQSLTAYLFISQAGSKPVNFVHSSPRELAHHILPTTDLHAKYISLKQYNVLMQERENKKIEALADIPSLNG